MAFFDRFRKPKPEKTGQERQGFFGRIFGRGRGTKPEAEQQPKQEGFFSRLFNRKKRDTEIDLDAIRRAKEEAEEAERKAREAIEEARRAREEQEAAERARQEPETEQQMRDRMYEEYKEQRRSREPEAKEEDIEQRFKQFEKSYETFKSEFGDGLSLQQFRDFVDIWGGISSDVKQTFGDSKDKEKGDRRLVVLYTELNDDQRGNFAQFVTEISEEVSGKGYNQEQAFNYLLEQINAGRL